MTKLLCYMATPGGLTGAPRRLLTLCEALRDHEVDAQLVSDGQSQLLSAGREMGIPAKPMTLDPLLQLRHGALFGGGVVFKIRVMVALIMQNLRFARFVRQEKADAVWIRGSKSIAIVGIGAWLARCPIIWDVDYELPSRGIVKWLHQLGISLSRAIVFQYAKGGESIFGKENAHKYKNKMHSLIPGVELGRLDHFKILRNKHKESNILSVLQVGTICDRKNQLVTIRALGEIGDDVDMPPLKVRFVGGVFEQEYFDLLEQEVSRLDLQDQVEFLGWRDDVHQLMSEADLLVMPSKDEGVPNTVQEAMYIGLPVVVSNMGGMPEIVDHGKTGWVLPCDDHIQWAEQMKNCFKNKVVCQAVGEAASIYATAHFSTGTWSARYSDIVTGKDCWRG